MIKITIDLQTASDLEFFAAVMHDFESSRADFAKTNTAMPGQQANNIPEGQVGVVPNIPQTGPHPSYTGGDARNGDKNSAKMTVMPGQPNQQANTVMPGQQTGPNPLYTGGAVLNIPRTGPHPLCTCGDGGNGDKNSAKMPSMPASITPGQPNQQANTAMPGQQAVDVPLDADGIPWDERIHTANKATTVKGCWKTKRGLPDGFKEQIEAELKAGMAAASGPAMAVPSTEQSSTSGAATAEPSPTEVFGTGVQTDMTNASTMPGAVPPAANTAAPGVTFPEFMLKITEACNSGKVTVDFINAKCNELTGTAQISALATRPDLIPLVLQAVGLA